MKLKKLLLIIAVLVISLNGKAQEFALKTNLLYDATASVNLGMEIGLSKKWTLDISGDYNNWEIKQHKWKHWFAQPEFRYWFCEKFNKGFFAINAIAGQFNLGNLGEGFGKLSDSRYQGVGYGGGIAVGYAWILGEHWNLEAEIGVGYMYFKFDEYNPENDKVATDRCRNYIGPTKAALSFVYIF